MLWKYDHVSKRKTSPKNVSMYSAKKLNGSHGKSVAGLQMVETVKEGYLWVRNTTRKGPDCNTKTHKIYLSNGKSYLNQESQGKYEQQTHNYLIFILCDLL